MKKVLVFMVIVLMLVPACFIFAAGSATQLQMRRGSTAQLTDFIGAIGEVTVDTTKHVVVVHDGTTKGGEE